MGEEMPEEGDCGQTRSSVPGSESPLRWNKGVSSLERETLEEVLVVLVVGGDHLSDREKKDSVQKKLLLPEVRASGGVKGRDRAKHAESVKALGTQCPFPAICQIEKYGTSDMSQHKDECAEDSLHDYGHEQQRLGGYMDNYDQQVIATAESSEQRVAHGSACHDECAKGNILNFVTVQSSVDSAVASQRLI
ncbi:hypothetical protein ACRRTK_001223 [Alexandromys fortis]